LLWQRHRQQIASPTGSPFRGKKKIDMAKLATIEYDHTGRATVTHTELPPLPDPPPSLPKKRVPSSPHKPFTSANFYDLTQLSSPEITPKSTDFYDLTQLSTPEVTPKPNVKEANRSTSSGFRALRQMDRENNMPEPFIRKISPSNAEPNSQRFRKGISYGELTDSSLQFH
jgi:hypothetical protein